MLIRANHGPLRHMFYICSRLIFLWRRIFRDNPADGIYTKARRIALNQPRDCARCLPFCPVMTKPAMLIADVSQIKARNGGCRTETVMRFVWLPASVAKFRLYAGIFEMHRVLAAAHIAAPCQPVPGRDSRCVRGKIAVRSAVSTKTTRRPTAAAAATEPTERSKTAP